MGSKRIGLARLEALMENLKRDLAFGGATFHGVKQKIDASLLNQAGGVTTTLTKEQSGTKFIINGTADTVVNLPALSVDNVGITYEFIVTTAVGGAVTTTFVCAAGGDHHGIIRLTGAEGTAATTFDIAGDTLTLVNSTVVGTRVWLTCISDNGTAQIWDTIVESSPLSTIGS